MAKHLLLEMTIVLLAIPLGARFSLATPRLAVKVEPNEILIGASYNGATIAVSGTMPDNAEAFVRVIGRSENIVLKKKGRALGLLWMNMGEVILQGVPTVFLLSPSRALAKSMKTRNRLQGPSQLGFDSLKSRIQISPPSEDKDKLFDEFLKLKKSASLYGIQENAVSYKKTGASTKAFTATIALPADLPQGSYKVEVFALQGGDSIAAKATGSFKSREVGLPAFMASFAFNHATLYGILAVLIAVFAGLLTGVVFRGDKEAH